MLGAVSAVRAIDPGNAGDRDPLIGEGFGLLRRCLAIDAAALTLPAMNAPCLVGEAGTDIFAGLLDLGAHLLQERAYLVRHALAGNRHRRATRRRAGGLARHLGGGGRGFPPAWQRWRHQRPRDLDIAANRAFDQAALRLAVE